MDANLYATLQDGPVDLSGLDQAEWDLLDDLFARFQAGPRWAEFANYSMRAIGDFYLARGLSRTQILDLPVWKVARDLKERLMAAAGRPLPDPADYRDDLDSLIRMFPNPRAFCEATGLPEEQVQGAVRKRAHLPIDALTGALGRIGYRLQIVRADTV